MNEDDIATHIFVGINRCVKYTRGLLVEQDYAFLPKLRELSFFKNPLIRDLIFLLGNQEFWMQYERRSIRHFELIQNYKKEEFPYSYPNIDDQFNENIIILTPGKSLEEKSILLRIIFILMGVNPYKDLTKDDLDQIYRAVNFEINKLLTAFRLIDQIESYKYPQSSYDSRYFRSTPTFFHFTKESQDILGWAAKLIDCTFLTWSYSLGQSINELHHYYQPRDGISEKQLVCIWGGTIKGFKNEINLRKRKGKEIIKVRDFGPKYASYSEIINDKKELIEMDSAIEWLDTKSINTTFLDQPKVRDYNFKDVEEILNLSSIKSAKSKIKKYLSSIKKFVDNDQGFKSETMGG